MSEWPIDWRALVGEAIRRRKSEGLTQRSLAALAGVSVPTVNAFEQGEINLRFERIVAILDTLGLFTLTARTDDLQSLMHASRQRWQELIEPLAEDDPSRQPHGHSEQAYAIEGLVDSPPSLSKLRNMLADAPRTSGWSPFWVPARNSIKPTIQGGLIECWMGKPAADRVFTDAGHSDFWRVSREGRAYLQRGFQEDGADFDPGTIFDLALPILRTAEVLRHAAWLARELGVGDQTKIRFIARYTGLSGRELLAWARPALREVLKGRYRARTDSIDLEGVCDLEMIQTDLDTVVSNLLRPLYERFDGYALAKEIVKTVL